MSEPVYMLDDKSTCERCKWPIYFNGVQWSHELPFYNYDRHPARPNEVKKDAPAESSKIDTETNHSNDIETYTNPAGAD